MLYRFEGRTSNAPAPDKERGIVMASTHEQEVVLQVPDIGLDDKQLHALKDTFQNHLVTTLGGKSAAVPRIVVVRIRVVYASKEV